jgi:hypothetical protein
LIRNNGTQFEKQVYSLIIDALMSNAFGLLPDACKVHHRMGYFSRDREKDIIIDISIEGKYPVNPDPPKA